MVTFGAGYIAGVFCAIVSHPADTVVSKLNQHKGASALDVAKKLGFVGMYSTLYISPPLFSFSTSFEKNFAKVVQPKSILELRTSIVFASFSVMLSIFAL